MRFSLATTLLASAAYAAAQTNTTTTHTIMVGMNGTLTYSPPNITANAGDIVTFVFTSKNHTVTQSTFATPCTQLTNTSVTPNVVGISSGYVPVKANATEFPTWSFSLTDTNPLWFFCLQTNGVNHCQSGMVFSINETPEKSYAGYLANAKASNATIPNPTTNGAATDVNGSASNPSDVNSPTASSTDAPNGNPSVSGATPPAQSSGAALQNMKAPSIALGAFAVMLGAAF